MGAASYQNTGVINFGNQGLAGQQNVPIMQTAIGNYERLHHRRLSDDTVRPGHRRTAIATNATRMTNLKAANYPANMFVVNPDVAGGGAYLLTNDGASYLRRDAGGSPAPHVGRLHHSGQLLVGQGSGARRHE